MMNDEQIAERRAQIPVHCGSCGTTFPGDTELSNGACRDCCRADYHLLRKVERYRKALENIVRMGEHHSPMMRSPAVMTKLAKEALDG